MCIRDRDYIRAEHKLHSISKLFISQVIIPQVMFFEPIYIPWALNTGTCIQQGDLFSSAGLHRNRCLPQLTQEKLWRGFGKNAGEWTGRVEISKKEIPGSKRSMHTDLLQALKVDRLSSVFSPDGTSISASAAPNCGTVLDEPSPHSTG